MNHLESNPKRNEFYNINNVEIPLKRVFQFHQLVIYLRRKSRREFSIEKFVKLINSNDTIHLSDSMKIFWELYKENCGISISIRTFYWDLASEILCRNESLWMDINEDPPHIYDYFSYHFPFDYKECNEYDITRLEKIDYLHIGIDLLIDNQIPEEILPVYCRYLFLFLENTFDR